MNANEKHIWFPAKKYGWGWGPPCAWQGWVALALFVALLSISGALLLPAHLGLWIASVAVLIIAMFITCFVKGETPRWRWGESKEQPTKSSAERLAELDELHQRQLISEADYQAKRQGILKEL
jgi:hypothetical protein